MTSYQSCHVWFCQCSGELMNEIVVENDGKIVGKLSNLVVSWHHYGKGGCRGKMVKCDCREWKKKKKKRISYGEKVPFSKILIACITDLMTKHHHFS